MAQSKPWIARFKRSLKLLAKNFKRGFGIRDANISCIPRIDQTRTPIIVRDPHEEDDPTPMRTRDPPTDETPQ
eukprot:CAMPEP_0198295058 /NCGR_PEP_ID=MMETSP1449-20131203/25582_1 /TAXON_ID=420275 /ORGANISM="Attheya septentrionalis, Strain CCMP2084" /LENGTH=72 /DNA_ID=CAMNT_0043995229 /DNA_START=361 /DNA_END=579 /DNA_ORIENTATION=-